MAGSDEGKMTNHMEGIFDDIRAERARQDEKWGGKEHDENHTVSDWVGFINEHAGKAKEAAYQGDIHHARRRLLEVAALAVAGMEVLDKIDAYSSEKH